MGCLHIVTIGYLLLLPLNNINGEEQYDKNFIAGTDKFAVQLYSAFADMHPDKGIVFSPLSIQMCATMALMGAKDETATELRRGLGFGSLDNDVLADMYNKFLTKYENSTIVKIYNKIYVKDGLKGLKPFVDTVKNKFNSEASNLDFVAVEEALISINDWIESKTNHLIKDFIPIGAIQRTARIILLNVVHFKTKWPTHPHIVECTDNTKCLYRFYSTNYFFGKPFGEALLTPFFDSNVVDLSVHPKVHRGIRQLDNYIKTNTLNDIIKQLNEIKSVYILRECQVTIDMGLVDAFQKLGMNRIFNKKDADFGDMLNVTESLKISRIIHRTNLDINYEGIEAVAATAIQFHGRCSGKFTDTHNALCDHPYMFTYMHKTENGDFIPIFMVRDP